MQALWMVLGSLFFATMAVCVKFASEWFTSSELVFYRGLLGMLFLWLLARSQGTALATRYAGMHAWRSVVGVVSLGAWFYAIANLPLATAMTLNYMSSVWVAAFLVGGALIAWNPRSGGAAPLRQGALVLTVLAGFAGVVMMLRPTIEQNQVFAGLIGLMSGLTAAFAYMQVMALGRLGDHAARLDAERDLAEDRAVPVLLHDLGDLDDRRHDRAAREPRDPRDPREPRRRLGRASAAHPEGADGDRPRRHAGAGSDRPRDELPGGQPRPHRAVGVHRGRALPPVPEAVLHRRLPGASTQWRRRRRPTASLPAR